MRFQSLEHLLLVGLLCVSPVIGVGSASDVRNDASTQPAASVVITEVDLPTEMVEEQEYVIKATVENQGEAVADVWLVYSWDGLEYIYLWGEIPPGDRWTPLIDRITLDRLADDLFMSFEVGAVHQQRVAVYVKENDNPEDLGPLLDERVVEVTIAAAGTNTGTSAEPDAAQPPTAEIDALQSPTERPAVSGGADRTQPADRNRGFFSNDGEDPPFIGNVFNLTVLGFVVSIVGLLYQMFQGR